MLGGEQVAGEQGVVTRGTCPQVEAAIRALHVHHRGEDVQHGSELLAVHVAVGAYMRFVVPSGNAGQLGLYRHGAAVVGAVQQEVLEDAGVAGDEARTQPWQVGALGQAVEHHATCEIATAQFGAGAKQAGRWCVLIEIQLAVALVGGDDEVVLVGQGDQFLQRLDRDQGAGGVAWRAEEQDLAALPDFGRHGIEVRVEAVSFQARQVMWLGAGEEGRTFVDLIEGVGADHQALGIAVDHRLGEGEQRFAGAIDRQHVARGIQPASRHAKAAFAPVGNALAQFRQAKRGRVDGELVEIGGQCLADEVRRAMLGFADGQGNRALVGGRLYAAEQFAQFLERVGLELVEGWIHRYLAYFGKRGGAIIC